MTNYTGKKAVVTGGTHGMGRAIAEALLERGAEVLITGRSEASLEQARRALGPRVHVARSDAASLADIDALRDEIERRLGGIDAVFINAGYAKLTPHDQVTEAEYDRHFAINTKGPYFTLQRLAPQVQRGGAFVLTTSVANAIGFPGMSVYAATKAALRSLAQNFAAELVSRGIRVNALSPGFIRTETMGIDGSERERAELLAEGDRATPMGRNGTPREVAAAALFLAFEATFTTGIELSVDGGLLHLQLPAEVRS
jgi:NAD(P)-dependent dehydrogenase (short-subunit alcohol dehydrogenase family)